MPSKVSDIHEIAVLIGFAGEVKESNFLSEKYKVFQSFVNEYAPKQIKITKQDITKYEDLFDRGLKLANLIQEKFKISKGKMRWVGVEGHKEDSSDIYIGEIGISLKDSSKIIRNSGFSQLLDTFCPNPIKDFNDPFLEFSPNLCVDYLHTVIDDCQKRDFIEVKDSYIYINNEKRKEFKGEDVHAFQKMELASIVSYLDKKDIKSLVKNFAAKGNVEGLLAIRKQLVWEVSGKVIAFLREGLLQNPEHVGNKLKYILQFRDREKLFGFSNKNFGYVGKIHKAKNVTINPKQVHTREQSKLTSKTTGLQINIYTTIDILFPSHSETIVLQNQLRYKHRTFSCAPEANFHLLQYEDWQKLYPE